MNQPLRNPGYYWVRFQGQWVIAEYGKFNDNGSLYLGWNLIGRDRLYKDDDFSDISEKTIKP